MVGWRRAEADSGNLGNVFSWYPILRIAGDGLRSSLFPKIMAPFLFPQ